MNKRGQAYSKRKIIIAILIVAFIVVASLLVYNNLFYLKQCNNFECFQNAMSSCTRASYVNEEPEASWGYKIQGKSGDDCVIDVKLLQAKQGELGIDKLQGYDMSCYYSRGAKAYPEKDLDKCHGRLKEELQSIIIKKLHTYVIENLGKFDESLNKAV